jgi:two-component system, NarL family, nitrate/nitrite response regulator NarL
MGRSCGAVIVERRPLLREALERVVSTRLRVVASIPSLGELDSSALSEFASVLVVLGSGTQPEAVLREIRSHREQRPCDRIVVLSEAEDSDLAISFMGAGADAYLDELIAPELLLEALDLVLMGKSVMPSGMMARILGQKNLLAAQALPAAEKVTPTDMNGGLHLSAREAAVLGCLVDGSSNKVIARRVEMAEATVKVHIKAILRKIRVKNRTQAAIWAMNNGPVLSAAQKRGGPTG